MICKRCGRETNGRAFCTQCGAKFALFDTPMTEDFASVTPPEGEPSAFTDGYDPAFSDPSLAGAPPVKTGKKKAPVILAIIAGILSLVLIGSAAYFVFSSLSEDGEGRDTEQGEAKGKKEEKEEKKKKEKAEKVLTKTVMVYMDGTDIEAGGYWRWKSGCMTASIGQMLDADIDPEISNVLIYTGGCEEWHDYGISSKKDGIYLIEGDELTQLEELDRRNMGDGGTLQDFMEYGLENYPADEYGLVVCNHGGGPLWGICQDERHGYDMISLDEMAKALSDAGFGGTTKLEFVCFDACLMGSIETASTLSPFANYMFASENPTMSSGTNYSFMNLLNTENSGAEIGKAYCDGFYDSSLRELKEFGDADYDITYSCLDLSKVDAVWAGLDNLFAGINEDLEEDFPLISSNRNDAYSVYEEAKKNPLIPYAYDLIDLQDYVEFYKDDYSKEVKAVKQAIDALVVYNRSSVKRMHGVTIYAPYHENHTQYMFAFSPEYTDFCDGLISMMQDHDGKYVWDDPDALVPKATAKDSSTRLSMKLTDEQFVESQRGVYVILADYDEDDPDLFPDALDNGWGGYTLVTAGNASLDEGAGEIKATYDNHALYWVYGQYLPYMFYQWQKEDGSLAYYSMCDYGYGGDPDDMTDMEFDSAILGLSIEGNKAEVQNAYAMPSDEESLRPETMTPLNFDNFQMIALYSMIKEKPYHSVESFWDGDTWTVAGIWLTMEEFQNGELRYEPIRSDQQYYAMFVIEDIYGEYHATQMVPIN